MAFTKNSAGATFANSKLLHFFGLGSDRAEAVVLEEVVRVVLFTVGRGIFLNFNP